MLGLNIYPFPTLKIFDDIVSSILLFFFFFSFSSPLFSSWGPICLLSFQWCSEMQQRKTCSVWMLYTDSLLPFYLILFADNIVRKVTRATKQTSQGRWRGATPRPRSRAAAQRSYSTFKVRRGSCEEIPLVQGKDQQLRFAEAAVKKYPMSKIRENQVRQ